MRQIFQKKSQYKILLIIIFIGVILSFAEKAGNLRPIRSGVQTVSLPFQAVLYQATKNTKNVLYTVGMVGSLRSENLELAKDNALLIAENERLKSLAQENKTLREQLGASLENPKELITAKTIGLSPLATKKLLLVDKGREDGVKNGMLVVIKDILIGQICEVTPKSSSIQLVSDPDSRIPSITSKKVRGVTVGRFGAEIELTEVVQGEKLTEGDLVLTTGEGGFSAGLTLGEIKEVKKVEKELFQRAVVAPLLSWEDLSTVFIVSEK